MTTLLSSTEDANARAQPGSEGRGEPLSRSGQREQETMRAARAGHTNCVAKAEGQILGDLAQHERQGDQADQVQEESGIGAPFHEVRDPPKRQADEQNVQPAAQQQLLGANEIARRVPPPCKV